MKKNLTDSSINPARTFSLSVVINVKDMAESLAETLKSVSDWADEIVVVDMKSTDQTRSVAKKFTQKVFEYDQELGFADPARNFALSKATSEWVLVLDADETITPELKEWIDRNLGKLSFDQAGPSPDPVAYFLPRQNQIFDYWLEHTGWWPDYQLRLFRRGSVQWSDKVHTQPTVEGPTAYLPTDLKYALRHHNYQHVTQFLERLNRYTTIQATQLGATSLPVTGKQVIQAFQQEFLGRLFAQEGWRDGVHGVSLSFLQATYELSVLLKRWETQKFAVSDQNQHETLQALQGFSKELAFWVADTHIRSTKGLARFCWQIRRKLRI